MKCKKSILTKKYKKGVYIEKPFIQKVLEIIEENPEIIQVSRYDDDSESYTIKITITNEQILKLENTEETT